MKKSTFAAIILSLFFMFTVSCSGGTTDKESNDPEIIIDNDGLVINIHRPPVEDFVPYAGVNDWETLLKEKYNVTVKLNYISPLHQTSISTADYYPGAIMNNEISGLIELNLMDYQNLTVLSEEGLILPLDEYLSDNGFFMSMSPAIRDSFRMHDGKIWALPAGFIPGIGTRYYRSEWLETLDLQVPQTLDELYLVSKAFAYDDPNGNGENDEYGIYINRRTSARMLFDIFLANECYISNYGACSIGYDYTTGAYEEAALKPGMLDTLEYVKSLHDAGLLIMTEDWRVLENNEMLGNFYDFSNLSGEYDNKFHEWSKSYSLNGNSDYGIIGLKPRKCYVLTSNTEDPSGTINSFVNTFMSGTEGMALGKFGLPGVDFELSGNVLTHKYEYSSTGGQSNFLKENINLISLNFDLIAENGVDINSSYYSDEYIDYEIERAAIINDMYINNKFFTDSFFLPHQDYEIVQISFARSMYMSFLSGIDTISPSDYIEKYIENQKKSGADQILSDINNKLGFSSSFHY